LEFTVTLREANKAKLEQQIFDTAISLFSKQGYQETTLIDIAAEANVSTRTLYKYFPTKQSILHKYARNNMWKLKEYALGLPADMPLEEKIVATMVFDYTQMFTRFDTGGILHFAKFEDKLIVRNEIENVMIAEAIYYHLLREEQAKQGVDDIHTARTAALVVVALYRMCTDLHRLNEVGPPDPKKIERIYKISLSMVWNSLYESLMSNVVPTPTFPFEPEHNSFYERLLVDEATWTNDADIISKEPLIKSTSA
jgi:AcrR family transcriptional regulator